MKKATTITTSAAAEIQRRGPVTPVDANARPAAGIPAQPTPRDAGPRDVKAGAGPVGPGERGTIRLRDAGPDDPPRYAPDWLELREGPDAAARAVELLDPLRIRLANLPGKAGGHVIHDLGCGTGSMGRWLAPGSTAPSTGSCTTATPTSCTSPPWPRRAPPPTAAASRSRHGAAMSPG